MKESYKTTYVKAKCKKTGRMFGLAVDNKDGTPKIRDFVPLSQEAYDALSPEYSVDPHIEVADTLLPCFKCGSRKFGSCSCALSNKKCPGKKDIYSYQCVFCDQLEFEYTSKREEGVGYSKWVGVSNIPAKAFDKHGNPQGDEYDLAKDGSMKGFTVVIIRCYSTETDGWQWEFVNNALRRKGFETINYDYKNIPSVEELIAVINKPKTQVWIISDWKENFSPEHYAAIIKAYRKGCGLYLWGDNDPLYVEANNFLRMLYGKNCYMEGDYRADQVISISGFFNKVGIVKNHPIAVGIQNFYEGVTIASIHLGQSLKPLVFSSDKNIVTAYDDSGDNRLLVDGGFTRLYCATTKAGTDRFVVNCAVWLANIEKWVKPTTPPLFK